MRIGNLNLPALHLDLNVSKPLHKLEDKVESGLNHAKDAFIDAGAEAIGYSELIGIRYPVKHYQEQVSPALTRGSRLESPADYDALKAKGFKAVIDLTKEGTNDEKYAQAKGLKLLRLPILDNAHPTMAQMKTFLDFVTNPANQPAYVHCEAGVGRTGIAVACYRMAVQHWTLEQALADAKRHTFAVPNQIEFLKKFDKELSAGRIQGYSR